MNSRLILASGAVLALALSVLAYGSALSAPLIFDDAVLIPDSAALARRAGLGEFLAATPWHLRPVTGATIWLQGRLFGDSDAAWRWGNLLIHAGVAVAGMFAVGAILQSLRIQRWPWIAAGAALLWTVHPLGSNAVMQVAQRSEMLSVGLALVSTAAFVWACRADGLRRVLGFIFCAAAYAAAGLAKPGALVLPLILCAVHRTAAPDRSAVRPAPVSLTLLVLAAVGAAVAFILTDTASRAVGGGLPGTLPGLDRWTYLVTSSVALTRYGLLAVWPFRQCFSLGIPPMGLAEAWPCFLGVSAVVGVTAWGLWRRQPWSLVPASALIWLAPTQSVIPIHDVFQEYRMYGPLLSVLAGLGVGAVLVVRRYAALMPKRTSELIRAVALGAVAGLAALGLVGTRARADLHMRPVDLWADATVKAPWSGRAWHNMGFELMVLKEPAAALACFDRMVALRPGDSWAWFTRGGARLMLKDIAGAEADLDRSIALLPDNVQALTQRGTVKAIRMEWHGAIKDWTAALAAAPGYADARRNRATALWLISRLGEAEQDVSVLLKSDPRDAAAWRLAGAIRRSFGDYRTSLVCFDKAIALEPENERLPLERDEIEKAWAADSAAAHYGYPPALPPIGEEK